MLKLKKLFKMFLVVYVTTVCYVECFDVPSRATRATMRSIEEMETKGSYDNLTAYEMWEANNVSASFRSELPVNIQLSLLSTDLRLMNWFPYKIKTCNTTIRPSEKCIERLDIISVGINHFSICTDMCTPTSGDTSEKFFCDKGCDKMGQMSIGTVSCQVNYTSLSWKMRNKIKQSTFDICSIETEDSFMEINPCEDRLDGIVENVTWIIDENDVVLLIDGYSVDTWEDADEISSYDCDGSDCKLEECKMGRCNGDIIYCKSLSCRGNLNCYCKFRKESNSVRFKIGDDMCIPKCWGRTKAIVHKRISKPKESFIQKSCANCQVKCNETGVLVMTPDLTTALIRICKNPHCMVFETKRKRETFFELSLPMLTSTGDFTVEFWFPGSTKPYVYQTSCESFDICNVIECYICVERWNHFRCYNAATWSVVVLITLVVTIPYILLIKRIHLHNKGKGHYSTFRLRKPKFRREEEERVVIFKKKENNDQPLREESEEREAPRRQIRRPPRIPMYLAMLMLFTVCDSCAISSTLTVPSTMCYTSNSGVESCSLTQSVRLAVSPVGQISCYNMLDPQGKNIGSLSIETKSIDVVCNKRLLYYVPFAMGKISSERFCSGQEKCKDNICSSTKHDDRREIYGEGNEKLGHSGCMKSCGCSACGCFFCTDACHFYRAFFDNPTKEVLEVFDCPDWSFRVKAAVSMLEIGNSTVESATLTAGLSQEHFGIKMTLISVSVPPMPTLGDCFMKQGTMLSKATCNRKDDIRSGIVGEIQCPTENDAKLVTKSCISDSSLVSVQEANTYLSGSFNLMNLRKVQAEGALPLHEKTVTFMPDDGSVVAHISGGALMEIQMELKGFTLQAKSDLNKCTVMEAELSGCYSCSQGSILKIKSKTNFGNALGFIKCPDIGFEMPIHVSNLADTKNYTVHMSQSKIDTNCIISCPDGDSEFSLKGSLIMSVNLDFRSRAENVGLEARNSTSSWDWSSSDLKWPAIGIFGGLSTILLLLIGLCVVSSILRK